MSLIELKDVSKTYQAKGPCVNALCNVTLTVDEGEFVCVAGPSGSGKTTLLNLIGNIDTPTKGTVSIDRRETAGMTLADAAAMRLQYLGFIFQSFNLVPVLTAFENVEYVLLLKGLPASIRNEKVVQALKSVGLEDKTGKRPCELSGGEQQRVAVARAIVASPPIVLADEPTANLDSATGEGLVHLLYDLNCRQKTTFIFSSHDPKIIERAERIITLSDGKIAGDKRH